MTWFGWVLVGIQVFGALAYVAQIGKPSEPRTPRGAVIFLVVAGAIAAGILTIGTGRGL